jgi:hypothetical protein
MQPRYSAAPVNTRIVGLAGWGVVPIGHRPHKVFTYDKDLKRTSADSWL